MFGFALVKLGDIIYIRKGVQFNKENMAKDGTYPVINGGVEPSGYIEQFNETGNTITISQGGASAGYVNWLETKFWAGAHCYVIRPIDTTKLHNRYLYYLLKNSEEELIKCQYGAGIPALGKSVIQSIQIALPSIEKQNQIVEILDGFDKLCNDISEGLPAEIEARQKQYEYYRDKLLNFN